MDALFRRVQNFFVLLLLGKDRACTCVCGRNQVYYVTQYDDAQSLVGPRKNYFYSDTMNQQEMDVIAGLLSGLFIGWFLMWLDRVWHSRLKDWTSKLLNDLAFWSRTPKFSNAKDLCKPLSPKKVKHKHSEDSRGKVHFKKAVYQSANASI